MSAVPVDILLTPQSPSTLGEGTAWWRSVERLVTVDIAEGRVKFFDPLAGHEDAIDLGGEVSAVVPRRRGGMIAAVGGQLRAYDRDGQIERTWDVELDTEANRLNDCRSDTAGRLWAGTMSRLRTPDQAALYRLDGDGKVSVAIAPTTLSNGLAWSPDDTRLYFVDSTTYRVDVLDYDIRTGSISNRRPFAVIDERDGLPDGLTVDADGGVWLALFGGGAVRRYSPSGELTHHIALPVTNPTCPAFGGPDLDTLFVTSARIKLTEEQLSREPAGALLALAVPGHRGLPANECAL
ncbi:SMP-30/gluconolactonase/LRE family protein [Microbacterium sp. 179-I 3D3 NHS]|uniref:SMP-30/gluconolactonase/LRE family protein n=1 Tax=unclassified Microbacterium TaxID=2609290 RepID=UPI00399F48A6